MNVELIGRVLQVETPAQYLGGLAAVSDDVSDRRSNLDSFRRARVTRARVWRVRSGRNPTEHTIGVAGVSTIFCEHSYLPLTSGEAGEIVESSL